MDIINEVKKIEKDIIKDRRNLHKIPELGLNLPNTVEYVKKRLEEMGIPYNLMVNGNAIVGMIEGKKDGKTIALRADMDGLPIKEETGLEFQSTNGCMHACGHDGHTAMLLGAAKILNENKDKIKGNIKLIFQPGEEYPGGAKPMIDEGVLENPKVDRIIGLHAGQLSKEVPKGKIGIKYNEMMASMDRVYIKVRGKGGHGAYPELTIDPIVIAAEIVLAIQKIKSREIKATEPVVISLCRINGGINQNIIPDTVEIEGTIRTFNNDTREYISKRIEQVVQGITISHNAEYEYEYDFKYPPLINDIHVTEDFYKSSLEILNEEDIVELKEPLMGGEDMAYYLQEVPGTFFYLSNLGEIDGKEHPHHNSKFTLDESLLYLGTSLFINYSFFYLNYKENI